MASGFNREKWFSLTVPEQLGNIGSEYDRILSWKQKNQPDYSQKALARTLELIDLTAADPQWRGSKLRELMRLREWICQEFFSPTATGPGLKKYFLQYATLARAKQGH